VEQQRSSSQQQLAMQQQLATQQQSQKLSHQAYKSTAQTHRVLPLSSSPYAEALQAQQQLSSSCLQQALTFSPQMQQGAISPQHSFTQLRAHVIQNACSYCSQQVALATLQTVAVAHQFRLRWRTVSTVVWTFS
jgi:hypothetical protein